jgi:hypothetical protein
VAKALNRGSKRCNRYLRNLEISGEYSVSPCTELEIPGNTLIGPNTPCGNHATPDRQVNSIIVKSGLIAMDFRRLIFPQPMKLSSRCMGRIAREHYCFMRQSLLRQIAINKRMANVLSSAARRRPSRSTRAGTSARIR